MKENVQKFPFVQFDNMCLDNGIMWHIGQAIIKPMMTYIIDVSVSPLANDFLVLQTFSASPNQWHYSVSTNIIRIIQLFWLKVSIV